MPLVHFLNIDMTFEIGFNRKDRNDTEEFYEFIGAKLVGEGEDTAYMIDIPTFEDLEKLLAKINQEYFGLSYGYSAILAFDHPTIYLDRYI